MIGALIVKKSKALSVIYVLFCYVVALVIGFFNFRWIDTHLSSLFWSTLIANIITTTVVFIFSVVANNSSVYDPYWSLIPPFILMLWLHEFSFSEIPWHLFVIFSAVCLWSIRLTFNWLINWQGMEQEDWRYVFFRNKTGKWYWIVSYSGIHLFPTFMVYLGLTPLYFVYRQINKPNILLFSIGIAVSLIGTLISLLADYSLYQHRKSNISHLSIRRGIWKYSRHPNYLGELTFWFSLLLIGLSYSYSFVFTGIGFIAMVVLFLAYSIPAIEKRMLKRRTDYSEIIQSVPKLLPIPSLLVKRM